MAHHTPPGDDIAVDRHEAVALCLAALDAAGAARRVAELLTESALYAEDRGRPAVGVAHLLDHLDALADGRIDGRAVPRVGRPAPAVVTCDARGGIAQAGFDEAFPALVRAARRYGLAAFAQHGSFTGGALGWFPERLAEAGLVALATAGSPAALATAPGTGRVLGTSPMAWSVPCAGEAPFTVDQSASGSALVSVRDAAARGTRLPEGWAVDAAGRPSTDPEAALAGALLPFGGYKGANIALLVELLSGLAGGAWSLDAPPWDSGSRSPSAGMFVLAVDHGAFGRGFPGRVADQLRRLAGRGVRLPGRRRSGSLLRHGGFLSLRADVVAALRDRARVAVGSRS